jgi:hypothetical protein
MSLSLDFAYFAKEPSDFLKITTKPNLSGPYSDHVHTFFTENLKLMFI